MFDCLDTSVLDTEFRPSTPAGRPGHINPAPTALQLARRYPGRSWLRLRPQPGQLAQLAKAREVALYLDAQVEKLADGSVLILDLTLNETLALSERFGRELASEALIAGDARYG